MIDSTTTTYAIQQHNRTGDLHALRYEGNRIIEISDALHYAEAARLRVGDLAAFDYKPYAGNPDGLGADGRVAPANPGHGRDVDGALMVTPNLSPA